MDAWPSRGRGRMDEVGEPPGARFTPLQRAEIPSSSAKARRADLRGAFARLAQDRVGVDAVGVDVAASRAQPVLDDRRRDLGVELDARAAADGERLRGARRARAGARARRQGDDVLVPGEPAAGLGRLALDVDPADLGPPGALDGRRRARAASAWAPKQTPSTGTPAACASRRNATSRAIHGSGDACTEWSEPSATTALPAGGARPLADLGRVEHVERGRRARVAQSAISPAGASGCCSTTRRSTAPSVSP